MVNPACFVRPQNLVFSPAGLGPGGNADGSRGECEGWRELQQWTGGPGEDQSSAASVPFPAHPHRLA